MRFSTIVASTAAAAAPSLAAAAAAAPTPGSYGITAELLPAPTVKPDLEKRAVDYSCASSVLSQLTVPTPNTAILSALSVASASASNFCHVTMNIDQKDAYPKWIDEVRTYYTTAPEKAKSIHTKCGADIFTISFRNDACSTSLTALYTSSGAESTDIASSTSFAPFTVPTNRVNFDENGKGKSAAGRGASIAVSSVVLAAVLGVAMAL